jgi:hypothetical protein
MKSHHFPGSLIERVYGHYSEKDLFNGILNISRTIVGRKTPSGGYTPLCSVLEDHMREMTFRLRQDPVGVPLLAKLQDMLEAKGRIEGEHRDNMPLLAQRVVVGNPCSSAVSEREVKTRPSRGAVAPFPCGPGA